MRRARRVFAVVALTTLVRCSSLEVSVSTPTSVAVALRLYSTTATVALLDDLTTAYNRLHPAFTFQTDVGNNQRITQLLLDGKTPYFLSNHLPANQGLWAAPIGQDGIAVITHPDNPVTDLTMAQLRAIYQGYVRNWREVDGPNQEIVVLSREEGSGTRAEFEQLVMGNRFTTHAALVLPSSEAMLAAINQEPASIGYISISYLTPESHTLALDGIAPTLENVSSNLYPLRATIFVIGLEEPQEHYRAFIGWIQSPQGQMVVARHYAPLLYLP